MVDGKRVESPMDRVWNLFTSLKLAIFVLIFLALTSIDGTLIEQNQTLDQYRQFFSEYVPVTGVLGLGPKSFRQRFIPGP